MQILTTLFFGFMLGGCLYYNSCGFSNAYWDEKQYYYDAEGKYHEVCPQNLIYKNNTPREEEVW